ncbi:MAG: alpha-mannosidase [Planctomycetes bacterium GWC2_45_44]|nr:MAG: alpha-mannosidase [Planctomycetes bacterium GWC2_45_44]
MKKEKKDIGYIIPHTHWDREWRYPVWKTRELLVEFMDQLLEILETNPSYKCFIMDGQCAPIEDYLEVRPGSIDKISKFVSEGRIAIGPWYTLPDLYPIDGECLVRNLLKGIRFSQKFGGFLKVGYTTFGWGQTAQFPQIYKGFGFDFIITAKKVSEERAPDSEFLWESPDGTRVLTSRLGDFARANFFLRVYVPVRFGVDWLSDEYVFSPQKVGLTCHQANLGKWHEDYFVVRSPESYYPEKMKEQMLQAWHATDATVAKDTRLFLSGCDFSTPQPDISKIIVDLNKLYDDKQFVHGTLDDYMESFKKCADLNSLKVVKGELRDGPPCFCSANALASRITIKQLNKKVQNIMLHKTEPLASLLFMLGHKYPEDFLNLAWKYILQAHPHDSINGVTQDKTANDTVYKLNQAMEISEVVYEQLMAEIIKLTDFSNCDEDENVLVVFNPLPYTVRDAVMVCVDTPRQWDAWDVALKDSQGKEAAVQIISRQEVTIAVHDLNARPWPYYVDRHICYIDSGEIAALSHKIFRISTKKKFYRKAMVWPPMRESTGNEISKSVNALENEYLKVSVAENGTLTVVDKATGDSYSGLHYFEDTGDIGDYWTYYPPYYNGTYNSLISNARICCEQNGILAATLLVEMKMEVPAFAHRPEYGIRGESKRAEQNTEVIITSYITLKRGSRRVEIKTKIANTAEDHRLRVLFPTGIKSQHSCASGHYTVDERPILPQKNSEGLFYPEMQTLPQQHFVDVSDGIRGLAVLNNCLTEYEVQNDDSTTLALTLFRSVRNIICTDLRNEVSFPNQKGGQCAGLLEFEYAIYPHKGNWEEGSLYRQAEEFNVPLTAVQTTAHKKGKLPAEVSFLSVQPEGLVLSAVKKAEDRDSIIIRLYNPTNRQITGEIKTWVRPKQAYLTNLNEERQGDLTVSSSGSVVINAGTSKIVTVELVFS